MDCGYIIFTHQRSRAISLSIVCHVATRTVWPTGPPKRIIAGTPAFRPLAVNAATAAPATARDAVWLLCAASSSTSNNVRKFQTNSWFRSNCPWLIYIDVFEKAQRLYNTASWQFTSIYFSFRVPTPPALEPQKPRQLRPSAGGWSQTRKARLFEKHCCKASYVEKKKLH